jgi:acyl-coenzyme A thioesterase PaaI-like protein
VTVHIEGRGRHILSELGFSVTRVGDELHGTASVYPELHVTGTHNLRTSVLAIWADHLAGLLAMEATAPRVPVTLELDVHLYGPTPVSGTIAAVANTIKRGRSVFVARVQFTTGSGEPIGIAIGTFMASPDPTAALPSTFSIDGPSSEPLLSVPLARRAGCERLEPGVAILPRSEDGLNSSNTVNGGLIALVTEEAVLSLAPGDTLCSLDLHYLHALRVGPAVAVAKVRSGLGAVEVSDAGNDNRLSVMAFTRMFGQ